MTISTAIMVIGIILLTIVIISLILNLYGVLITQVKHETQIEELKEVSNSLLSVATSQTKISRRSVESTRHQVEINSLLSKRLSIQSERCANLEQICNDLMFIVELNFNRGENRN